MELKKKETWRYNHATINLVAVSIQKRIKTAGNCILTGEIMVTKSKRDVEIRRNAKNFVLTFLNAIKHHEFNGKNVYAL